MCRWRRSQLSFLGVLLGTMSRHQGLRITVTVHLTRHRNALGL